MKRLVVLEGLDFYHMCGNIQFDERRTALGDHLEISLRTF